MLNVFIGYDKNEIVAYHVAVQSIIDKAQGPVSFTPVCIDHLHSVYLKDRHPAQSTDFSMTRFLVPFLSGYKGASIFVDCDVILRDDINTLAAYPLAYPDKAVFVAKHEYVPSTSEKFLHQKQSVYPKKNWSSVMVFNNEKCEALTPSYVNNASGLDLHQFKWLESDDLIGDLSLDWNHLVGEYPENADAKLVHYTLGTPCFSEWKDQEHSEEWFKVMGRATSATDSCYHTIKNEVEKDPALEAL